MRVVVALVMAASFAVPACLGAEDNPEQGSLNKAERLEWFRDQGFGLFIHWSVDSQLGVVISHSLVGASPEYTDRFFQDLPKTFDPHGFDPLGWARLAHLAGIRYVMFTAKHHSGFGHVRHHYDFLWHHAHSISPGYHQGSFRRIPFAGNRRRRLFLTR